MLFAEISPVWSGVFALLGAAIGGLISIYATLYSHRLTFNSKEKAEWLAELRKTIIAMITEATASKRHPIKARLPLGLSLSTDEEYNKRREERSRTFAELLAKVSLMLSDDKTDKELLSAIIDLQNASFDDEVKWENWHKLRWRTVSLARKVLQRESSKLDQELKKLPFEQV